MGAAQLVEQGMVAVMPMTVAGTQTSVYPAGSVPGGVTQMPLTTTPSPKQSNCMAKAALRVNSPSAWQTLRGVGSADDVSTADTLYLKSDGAIAIQLTMQTLGSSGTTTSVVYLYGMMKLEFPSGGLLVGLAAQGSAGLEYLISGPA